MLLSLALGPVLGSAHASRGGGGVGSCSRLSGVNISGPASARLRTPLPGLGSFLRRRDASCGVGSSGSGWKVDGEVKEASVSRGCAAVGAGSGTGGVTLGWCSQGIVSKGKARGQRAVCSATALGFETLQWISSISCLILMLAKGTAIQKSFLAPLFVLQAPVSVVSWIKGEYGIWTAFLALLVRLFYFIPGELDLPLSTMLLVIVSPHQTMDLRETKIGAIISLVIAGYLLFQHFSRAGRLQNAFDQGSVVATLAIICIVAVPCLLLF